MKDENKSITVIVLLVLGLVVVSGLYAMNAASPVTKETADRETVTVSETVEMEVMPDEVQLYVEIKTRGESASAIKTENAELSDAVLEALYEYGLSEEQIETTSYYLSEETKWNQETQDYVVTGYVLTNTLKVTTSDIENAGEIIDVAVDAGATSVNNIQFTLSRSKESEVKAEVLALAAEKAQEKAKSMVNAVDVELGELVSITESSYYGWQYPMYRSYDGMEMAEDMGAQTSISPEQITVTGTVTLTYAIKQ